MNLYASAITWFFNCFEIYSDFSYFLPGLCRLFSSFWAGFGAVLGISAVSATFSWLFSGFLAKFGSCFGDFCSFSYFFSAFLQLFGWVRELFWGFLQFQLLFTGFSPAFWLSLRSCFGDFCSSSYFLPVFLRLFGWVWIVSSPPRRYEIWTASFSILACASSVIRSCFSSPIIRSNR